MAEEEVFEYWEETGATDYVGYYNNQTFYGRINQYGPFPTLDYNIDSNINSDEINWNVD